MPTVLDKNAWAVEFLKGLGNTNPSPNTIKFVQAWEIQESGTAATIGCDHNPLNTTQPFGNTTNCNSTGVKNYNDNNYAVGSGGAYKQGLDASVKVMNNGMYPNLLHALQTNDENNLGFNGNTMSPNIAGDLSVWVNGKRTPMALSYVSAILSLAGQKKLPPGGDIGQVTPANIPNPLDCINDFPNCIKSALLAPIEQWATQFFPKFALFLLALVLFIAGAMLLFNQQIIKGVKTGAKAAAIL